MAGAEWEPLKFKPLDAVAAVRLRFVQLFPSDAKSWDRDQQHPPRGKNGKRELLNVDLAGMLGELEGESETAPDDGGPREADISRLWSNNYGIKAKDGGGSRVVALALKLFDRTFAPVVGQRTTAVTSNMANATIELDSEAKFDVLNAFRARYEGMIDPLRSLPEAPVDVLAIIAHYDDWIVYLTDLVADSRDKDRLSAKNDLRAAVDIALDSGQALRKRLGDQPRSASLDLYRFQRLTNELQTHCAAVGSKSGKDVSSLKEAVKKAEYFEQLDRYLEITKYSRIDEAVHGLSVATMISDEELMWRYGLLMVGAMQRVLVKAAKVTPTASHPVMTLEQPLLSGEPPLVEISQLAPYVKAMHRDIVKAALSGARVVGH